MQHQPAMTSLHPVNEPEKLSIGYICLLGFVFSIIISPIRIFPPLAALQLQDVLAIVAVLGFVARIFGRSEKIKFTAVECYFIALILMTGIGLFNLLPYDYLGEGMKRYENILKTGIILLMLGGYAAGPVMFRKGFLVFIVAIALFELHGMRAILSGTGMSAGRFDSWIGLISNSDEVGAFLVMVLPLQLELYLYYTKVWKRNVMLGLAMVNIILMVLTQTRSAFLSFLIVFPLWIIRREGRGKRLLIASMLLGIMAFAGVTMTLTTEYSSYYDRMASIFSREAYQDDANVQSRFLFWEQGLLIWQQFPILGCGVGGMDLHETLTSTEKGLGYTEGLSLSQYSLHQSFIQVLAERGLIGFSLYCLFLWTLLRANKKSIVFFRTREQYQYYYSIARGLHLSLYAFLINAMFMTITESWMIILCGGFIIGLYKVSRNLQKAEVAEHTPWH